MCYLRFIRERAALFFGLADSTMSHDDAWRFLILGRSLERVDMTARLLLARMPDTPYEVGWPMLLRACGAYESFIRSHGWAGGGQADATEFLILDRLFPRSVLHTLGDRGRLPGVAGSGRGPGRDGGPGATPDRGAADEAGVLTP